MRAKWTAMLALVIGLAGTQVAGADDTTPAAGCFHIRDLEGWKATPDNRTLYVRVSGRRVFRLDLAARCSLLSSPDAYLVTESIGSDFICKPIDWNLRVAENPGGTMGCIVHAMSGLSPDDVKALPKKLRP